MAIVTLPPESAIRYKSAAAASDDVKKFTSAITKMSSFSGGDAKEALQVLTEKGIDVSKAMGMEGTIADVAAGQNTSLSDAANLVADAYHGKAKALVNLGILSKDEVKQLGNSEDATISMADVQQRLNDRFGGSAQAQLGTYAGQMKQMENQMNSAKTAIGSALLPILAQLAAGVAKVVIPIAEFIKQNPKFIAAILSITAILGTLVGGASAFNTLKSALGPLNTALSGFGLSMGGLAIPVLVVTAAITLLAAAGYEIYKNWDTIKAKAHELGQSINTVFPALKGVILSAWEAIKTATGTIEAVFVEAWSAIKTAVIDAWNYIVPEITNGVNQVASFWREIWPELKQLFVEVWDVMKAVLGPCVAGFYIVIAGALGLIKGIWQDTWNLMKDTFKLVWDAMTDVLKIEWDILSGIIKVALDLLTGNWSKAWEDMKSVFTNLWSDIKGLFGDMANDAITWGADLIKGLINGIKGMVSGVVDAVKGVANTISSYLHFSTPNEGPLAEYESWMPDFMGGLAAGIERNKSKVTQAIQSLSKDMGIGVTYRHTPSMPGGAGIPGSIPTTNQYNFAPGSVVIPAKDLAEMHCIQDFFERLPQVARARG